MKVHQDLKHDLLKISSALASFSNHHNTSPALKAHIDMQCSLLKQTKAIKGCDSVSGLSARAIYGTPQVASTFEEALKRDGSIFIANRLGKFISEHDAKQGLIALNEEISTMTAAEKEQFKQFMDSVSSGTDSPSVTAYFQNAALAYSLLFAAEEKEPSPTPKRSM